MENKMELTVRSKGIENEKQMFEMMQQKIKDSLDNGSPVILLTSKDNYLGGEYKNELEILGFIGSKIKTLSEMAASLTGLTTPETMLATVLVALKEKKEAETHGQETADKEQNPLN